MTAPLYVVIGATGPLGAAVARHLRGRGDRVRGVNRSGRGTTAAGVELVAADVTEVATIVRDTGRAWELLESRIDAERRRAVLAIRAAADAAAIEAVLAGLSWPEIEPRVR